MITLFNLFLRIPMPSYPFDCFFRIPIFAFLPFPTLFYALQRFSKTSNHLTVIYNMLFHSWLPFLAYSYAFLRLPLLLIAFLVVQYFYAFLLLPMLLIAVLVIQYLHFYNFLRFPLLYNAFQ